jgi:hypothetical protein
MDGRLLASNHLEYMRQTKEYIALHQHKFGVSLMGSLATVKYMLIIGGHDPMGCLEIVECTGHLRVGRKMVITIFLISSSLI